MILLQYPPWQVLKKDKRGKILETSGLVFEILDQISYKLNFSYIVREPEDGQWGIRNGNSWSGMIRQLVDKEVTLSCLNLSKFDKPNPSGGGGCCRLCHLPR